MNDKESDKERRQAPRTPSNVFLDLYDVKGRMIIGEGKFVNLSMRGGLMESQKPLQLREPIRLHVQSATGKTPLELAGKVVWRRKKDSHFAYGIEFDFDQTQTQADSEGLMRKAS